MFFFFTAKIDKKNHSRYSVTHKQHGGKLNETFLTYLKSFFFFSKLILHLVHH